MRERSAHSDVEYHLCRARSERNIAYRSGDELAADVHMQLSALHLQRALLFQTVRRASVENIHSFQPTVAGTDSSAVPPRVGVMSALGH